MPRAAVDALALCGLGATSAETSASARARAGGTSESERAGGTRSARARVSDEEERMRTRMFEPEVLDAIARAPGGVPKTFAALALPRGVDAYAAGARAREESAVRYPTILTDERGERMYVACVSFLALTPERSARAMAAEGGWVPERARACACLVSRAPCLDAWMDAMWHVFEGYFAREGRCLPSLTTIAVDLVERLMWRENRAVLFPIGGALVALPPRGASGPCERGAFEDGKESLFRCLSVRTILQCLCLIASERRLLLRSDNVSVLVKCAEALRELVQPLVWRHVYIPCLATSMVDILGAPIPFIMGAARDVEVDERNLEGVAVLDLDLGTLRDGGERIHMPPDPMSHGFIQRVQEILYPDLVQTDGRESHVTARDWSPEINRILTTLFTDFWYELLQLDSLEAHIRIESVEDGPQLKFHDYNNALGHRRCDLTDRVIRTNAFAALLMDAATLSTQRKSKMSLGTSRRRAKFRCVQLIADCTVPPPPASLRITHKTLSVPRLQVLDFENAQNHSTALRSLSSHQPSRPLSDSASQTALRKEQDAAEGNAIEPTPSKTLRGTDKITSWSWVKDKVLKRKSESAKTLQKLDNDESSLSFDWYYNTLTKEDAATLADLVRRHRDRMSGTDEESAPLTLTEKSKPTIHLPNASTGADVSEEEFVDDVSALEYSIFNHQNDDVASALAEHAARVNYVALLTGVQRQLMKGSQRFAVVATALKAVVLRADAAGDATSLAHALSIARKFQPRKANRLWLKGAARWDDINLWRGLMRLNERIRWFEGDSIEDQTEDIVRCFATVGLTSTQSSELLSQLKLGFDAASEVRDATTRTAELDAARSAAAYSSISFESWVETLRQSSAVHFGARIDEEFKEHISIPDCCPSDAVETQIWNREAITAMTVQSGVVSSLVAIGSGTGGLAFFAPDTGTLMRSQNQGASSAFSALTFVPRSSRVFCGRRDGAIETWDTVTCTRISLVQRAHKGERVSFVSPVVNQVISSAPLTASAGHDGTVKLWDARQSDSNRPVSVIGGHAGGVTAFSTRDARGGAVGSILTGDEAGVVRTWDPRHAGAGPVALAKAHFGRVLCLAPLHSSDTTASAGADGIVRILRLDGESGGDVRLSGHLGDISSLAVLQDETRGRQPVGLIASGSQDGEVCLWSGGELIKDARQPWRCVSKSRAHIGAIMCLSAETSGRGRRAISINANGGGSSQSDTFVKTLLSASSDRSFASWTLDTAQLRGGTSASWAPAAMHAPPRVRTTEASCAVMEPSRRRLITGDRFGTVACATLPTPAA